jgi:hypothetical protein
MPLVVILVFDYDAMDMICWPEFNWHNSFDLTVNHF